ncbi:MAG: VanZ family protein [Candidatus Omnitrophota bacterium]|nr:VanZ family protein [Candidatus Omnitrophota bacterium]
MSRSKRFLKFWVPLLVYMALMWFLSSRPARSLPLMLFPFADKVFHFLEYFVFGFLLARVIQTAQPKTRPKLFIFVIVSALIWGAIDELHQASVPLRDPSVFDLLTDCFGAGIGQLLIKRGQSSKIEKA